MTSFIYRSFKSELSRLSQMMWYFDFSVDYTLMRIRELPENSGSSYVIESLYDDWSKAERLNLRVNMFQKKHQEYLDHFRLQLLLKAVASFESYLERYIEYILIRENIGVIGYNRIDQRTRERYLKYSNMEYRLDKLKQLSGVTLRDENQLLYAYKMRCNAAHTGGVITSRTVIEISPWADLGSREGQILTLNEAQLLAFLSSIGCAAKEVETIIPEKKKAEIEFFWVAKDAIEISECIDLRSRKAVLYLREQIRKKYKFHIIPSESKFLESFLVK